MRNILIKHSDGSSIHLSIETPINTFSKIDVRFTGSDGYYKPELSWSDELPIKDIERQLENIEYKEFNINDIE